MKILEKRLQSITSEPLAIVAAAAVVFSAISIHLLRDFQWSPRDLHTACAAILKLAPDTGATAIKVWAFWAWSALLIATFVRKLDPKVEWFDASLIGMAGVWVLAYIAGTLLGPIGLFRAPTLWIAMIAATVYLWPNVSFAAVGRPSFGLGLALIAIVLAAVSLLPLQLGSPVVPYMDALAWPASAQRVLTFGRYLPFNNDPYGIYGPNTQEPALELFYAYLALGSHTRLAVLAESSMMFPTAALMILATYRLGVTLFDDVTGGAAALLLFFTTIFRWIEGMRGTAVDYALLALALALFLDSRRSRTLMACAALMLGVTLPSNAIDGALAMGVASAACGSWLLATDLPRFRAGALSIAGALLLGAPEFLIAHQIVVPVAALMLLEIGGAAVIIYGASRLYTSAGSTEHRAAALVVRLLLVILMAAALHDVVAGNGSVYSEVPKNFVLLGILALAGLVTIVVRPPPTDTTGGLCAIAVMLLPALVISRVLTNLPLDTSAASGYLKFELTRKVADYWMPFAMVFPAARFVALGCEVLPKAMVMTALLALLIFPLPGSGGIDYYTHEHSTGENWMIDFSLLSNGYWGDSGDPRWAADFDDFQLFAVLRNEIRAGRLTTNTNVLHLTHDVFPYTKWVRFSVFTGINDEPLVMVPPESEWEMFMVGSRARSIIHLKEELAKHPRYILSELPPSEPVEIPDEYERIFGSEGTALYRRNDSARPH